MTVNGTLKINPRQVYYTGMQYSALADRVRENIDKIAKIGKEDISGAWIGNDNYNFVLKLTEHAKLLEEVITFLEDKSSTLKETAINHNTSDSNFKKAIDREVDIDGNRYRG